jgi:hypothetical protein
MNTFEHGVRNPQRNIPPLVARTSFSKHKHTWLILKKLPNLISAQIPHFGDFRNGVVPLDVHRSLNLYPFVHCLEQIPPDRLKNIRLPGTRERLDSLRLRMYRVNSVSTQTSILTSCSFRNAL